MQRTLCTRIHRISRMTGTAQKHVCRIFHHDGFNPYHLQKSATHSIGSHTKTVYDSVHGYNHSYKFCLTFSSQETQFTKDGIKNTRIYTSGTGKSTPSNTAPFSTVIFSPVWSGVLGNTLIAVQVIERRLTALSYRNFLEIKLLLYIEDVPLASGGQMWL